jgi:TatD DNase family protein
MVDTHCHIHEKNYALDVNEVILNANDCEVTKLICVGTTAEDSKNAIEFASKRSNIWASIGLHPHDSKIGHSAFSDLQKLVKNDKIVAIGECGLDYFYNNSPKQDQIKALEFQIDLALNNNLPIIFHVRNAFDDFWPLFDNFKGISGVIHSFTATTKDLDNALNRGLYIGLNGIMTFSKDQSQLDAAKAIPLDKLVLETDSPFLSPSPLRGKVNQPSSIKIIAEFLSNLRGESFDKLAYQTTANSEHLFGI